MGSPVFFADGRQKYGKNLFDKLKKLLKKLELKDMIAAPDTVAVKVHWGEAGNMAYVPPQVARAVVDHIKSLGGKPFITDTNTLYAGTRRNAVDNITTAVANGFSPSVVGAPVIVADGLYGHDYVSVPVNGKHFETVKIASAIHHAKSLFVISHAKGHLGTGLGGSLKNISMGCAVPSGKQNMHSEVKPAVDAEQCTACGMCLKVCPAAAISKTAEKKSKIDPAKCIGCAECVVVCQFGAISVNWVSDAVTLQEKMAEYAKGALAGKEGRCAFVNFLYNITPDCDCCNWNDLPFTPDIGILASRDPVAIDTASGDLINAAPWINQEGLHLRKPGAEDKFMAVHGIDRLPQLAAAEALGVGSRSYELIEVK